MRDLIIFSKSAGFLVLFPVLVAPVLSSTSNRPAAGVHTTVGLVLEGGGALGLAHIGVIQYLEEHHIPISYIAGTSMGGLVGGLYATGRDASAIRDVVRSIDWDQVISGQTPYDDLSYRRKQDARDYPSNLEFGLRNGLQFPAGFNSEQQVDLILDQATPQDLSGFADLGSTLKLLPYPSQVLLKCRPCFGCGNLLDHAAFGPGQSVLF